MPQRPNENYRLVGATPQIEKVGGSAIALCPTARLVAESGKIAGKDHLRIANYKTNEVLGATELPSCRTLAFSPNGKRIFASLGFWRNPPVFWEEPWDAPTVPIEDINRLSHGAWLDDDTILLVGRTDNYVPYVALLDVTSRGVRLLNTEGQIPNLWSRDNELSPAIAACSPSGLVAFYLSSKRQIALCQIHQSRLLLESKSRFDIDGSSDMLLSVAEDGRTILCTSERDHWVRLFDRDGHLLAYKRWASRSNPPLFYHQTALCSSTFGYRGAVDVEVFKVVDDQFVLWTSLSTNRGQELNLLDADDRDLLAIEGRDCTSVYALTDFDVVQLQSADQEQLLTAILRVGDRRLKDAVPKLGQLLLSAEPTVQGGGGRRPGQDRRPERPAEDDPAPRPV